MPKPVNPFAKIPVVVTAPPSTSSTNPFKSEQVADAFATVEGDEDGMGDDDDDTADPKAPSSVVNGTHASEELQEKTKEIEELRDFAALKTQQLEEMRRELEELTVLHDEEKEKSVEEMAELADRLAQEMLNNDAAGGVGGQQGASKTGTESGTVPDEEVASRILVAVEKREGELQEAHRRELAQALQVQDEEHASQMEQAAEEQESHDQELMVVILYCTHTLLSSYSAPQVLQEKHDNDIGELRLKMAGSSKSLNPALHADMEEQKEAHEDEKEVGHTKIMCPLGDPVRL
jgi:hypothetical protein